VVDDLSRRLVPDELWASAQPLIPGLILRPQGGGTTPVDDRAVLTAMVSVLTSGCARRYLPPSFGVTIPTAHRRFSDWTKAGLWRRLHRAVLDELGSQDLVDWSRGVLDGASVRANRGTHDRTKPGRPRPTPSNRWSWRSPRSSPDAVHAAANPPSCTPTKPTTTLTSADGSHATWESPGASPAKASNRTRNSAKPLGDRTIHAWLFGYCRLSIRYERYTNHFCAFLALGATLTCFKKLTRPTT
jgi:transposase